MTVVHFMPSDKMLNEPSELVNVCVLEAKTIQPNAEPKMPKTFAQTLYALTKFKIQIQDAPFGEFRFARIQIKHPGIPG